MKYDFDVVIPRQNTDSEKWSLYPEDVIPLWVADMDFRSPEPVIEALKARADHGIFGYPNQALALKETLVSRMEKLYSWKITPDDIVLIPGVVPGINITCHAFAQNKGVVIQPPVYGPFLTAPQNARAIRIDAPLVEKETGEYEIDWDILASALSNEARLMILCSPHNPVGRVWTSKELEQVAEFCLRNEVILCSDEIHCDLVYEGHPHTPVAAISPEIAQNTITLMAPSKTFNLPGLYCSFAIIQNPKLRETFQIARQGLVGGVNVMGLTAALAAYQDGEEWLIQLLDYLQSNRDYLFEMIYTEFPELQMSKPEGTYLAWIDCRKLLSTHSNPAKFFLEKAKVALVDGKWFGKEGEGFVRLNFACPRKTLQQALERMKHALYS